MSRDFGVWMKQMRAKHRYTQEALAKTIGVHTTTIMRWETGTQFPPLDMAERIFEVFGWKLKAIRGDEDDSETEERSSSERNT